jgi:hypothetical protein
MAARLTMLVDEQVRGRPIAVHISRANEWRLAAFIHRLNDVMPEEPLNPNHDGDLVIAVVDCMERGLRADEADCRVWASGTGAVYCLPRAVRAPWRMRVGIAARSAITAWRAS